MNTNEEGLGIGISRTRQETIRIREIGRKIEEKIK